MPTGLVDGLALKDSASAPCADSPQDPLKFPRSAARTLGARRGFGLVVRNRPRVDRRRCKKVTTGSKPANHTSDYTRTCRQLPCQQSRLIRPLLGTLCQQSCLLAGSYLGCHRARERSDLLFFCTFDPHPNQRFGAGGANQNAAVTSKRGEIDDVTRLLSA